MISKYLQSFSQSLEPFFLTAGQNNFGNKIPFPSASNFKSFSWSLEQYFLTKCQNNFGNKIPLPKMKLSLQLGLQQRFIKRPWQFFLHHGNSFLAGREIVEHECKVVHHHFSLDLEFCSSAASGILLTNSFFQCLDLMLI